MAHWALAARPGMVVVVVVRAWGQQQTWVTLTIHDQMTSGPWHQTPDANGSEERSCVWEYFQGAVDGEHKPPGMEYAGAHILEME